VETDEFFNGHPEALAIHRAIRALVSKIGCSEERVSKSQVGFYRSHPFAAAWVPDQYLGGKRPPLVLSVYLKHRDHSRRWKEVVEPAAGRFTHHIELKSVHDVDAFVEARLREAWTAAE
jgi:hypothetical protein